MLGVLACWYNSADRPNVTGRRTVARRFAGLWPAVAGATRRIAAAVHQRQRLARTYLSATRTVTDPTLELVADSVSTAMKLPGRVYV